MTVADCLWSGIAAARDSYELPDAIDEKLLASLVRKARDQVEDLGVRLFLAALADALDHENAPLRLSLKQKRRGQFKSPAKQWQQFERDHYIEILVKKLSVDEPDLESVIATIREKTGMSRAAVFGSLKRMRDLDGISLELESLSEAARSLMKSAQ